MQFENAVINEVGQGYEVRVAGARFGIYPTLPEAVAIAKSFDGRLLN